MVFIIIAALVVLAGLSAICLDGLGRSEPLSTIDEAICTLYGDGVITLEEAQRRLDEAIAEFPPS